MRMGSPAGRTTVTPWAEARTRGTVVPPAAEAVLTVVAGALVVGAATVDGELAGVGAVVIPAGVAGPGPAGSPASPSRWTAMRTTAAARSITAITLIAATTPVGTPRRPPPAPCAPPLVGNTSTPEPAYDARSRRPG